MTDGWPREPARLKRMVVLCEMSDGSQSGWEVTGGTLTIEYDSDPFCFSPLCSTQPRERHYAATMTASGRFHGLWLGPDFYRQAGFVDDEIANTKALPVGGSDAVG